MYVVFHPLARDRLFAEKDFGFHHSFTGFDFQPQVFHWVAALDFITRTTEQLVIFVIIAAAFCDGNDVVDLQIPTLKILSASVAFALLFFVQLLFNRGRRRNDL